MEKMTFLEWKRSGPLVGGLAVCLSLVGCRGPEIENADAAQVVSQPDRPGQQAMVMDSVQVLRVLLDAPVRRPDLRGEVRAWEQALMVRLAVPRPPAMGPSFNVFLNDELVPEYGEWEEGVYFWVYDPARLDSIDGRAVSLQFDRGPRVEVGTLTLDPSRDFRLVPMDSVRGGTLRR